MNQSQALRVKAAVRKRDGHRCTVCGMTNRQHKATFSGRQLEVHRKAPDGPYSFDNCVTLCKPCHAKQGRRKHGTHSRTFSLPLDLGRAIRILAALENERPGHLIIRILRERCAADIPPRMQASADQVAAMTPLSSSAQRRTGKGSRG